MLVVGVDPGIARLGYAFVEQNATGKLALLEGSVIETSSDLSPDRRLNFQYQALKKLLQKYRPESLAIEHVYHGANTKTVVSVGQSMGVVMLAASEVGMPVEEYTPLQVKMAVTGYGAAEKGQVQRMVKSLLGLPEILRPDDVADAVAIAICHLNSAKMRALA